MLLIIYILLALFLALLMSGMVIPKILKRSIRGRRADQQDYRKIHSGFASRLGGLSFFPIMLCSATLSVIGFCVHSSYLGGELSLGIGEGILHSWRDIVSSLFCWRGICLWLSAIVIYLIGYVDDTKGVGYKAKFLAQFVVAALLIVSGFAIDGIECGITSTLSTIFWYVVSALVIVLVIDAMNLIDGIDGLASGISIIALIYFGIIFLLFNDWIFAILAFALLGTVVPFFFYNTYDRHTKHHIFMGDTGSMTLGLVLVVFALRLCIEYKSLITNYYDYRLVYSFIPLAVPCFDVIRVFLHRIRMGVSPFKPDMNHIHHKLMKVGCSQASARRTILLASLLYIVSNCLFLQFVPTNNLNVLLLGIFDIVVYTIWNILLSRRIKRIGSDDLHSTLVNK